MQDGIKPFAQHLVAVFMTGMKDLDEEVRSNSVYGLGLLIQHSGEMLHWYPFLLALH